MNAVNTNTIIADLHLQDHGDGVSHHGEAPTIFLIEALLLPMTRPPKKARARSPKTTLTKTIPTTIMEKDPPTPATPTTKAAPEDEAATVVVEAVAAADTAGALIVEEGSAVDMDMDTADLTTMEDAVDGDLGLEADLSTSGPLLSILLNSQRGYLIPRPPRTNTLPQKKTLHPKRISSIPHLHSSFIFPFPVRRRKMWV